MKRKIKIAIDGPVAAGKGTVASILAKKLGIIYVETGAMYRAVAFLGMKNKINLKDENKLLQLLKKNKIEFKVARYNHGKCEIFLNKTNITLLIRTQEISWGASVVATLPKIREYLVKKQQEIAKSKSVVMEGRDITTRVLPDADFKIFLDAEQKIRAERRQKQLKQQGVKKAFAQILKDTKKRDYQDTHRKIDPLKIIPDAFVLDTTNLTISKVVEKILTELYKRNLY